MTPIFLPKLYESQFQYRKFVRGPSHEPAWGVRYWHLTFRAAELQSLACLLMLLWGEVLSVVAVGAGAGQGQEIHRATHTHISGPAVCCTGAGTYPSLLALCFHGVLCVSVSSASLKSLQYC